MQSLLDPAILFFVLGVFAGAVKSSLEIPPAISKFLSLYLLMALGLKGGFELAHAGLSADVMLCVGAAMLMAFVVPAMGYAVLRHRVSKFDAAAVAAAYGSVSAVTFLTAMQYLEGQGIQPGGHMAVAMVLMESPAILMAVVLANALRAKAQAEALKNSSSQAVPASGHISIRQVLHESFTDGAQVLLLGSLLVGFLSGDEGKAVMAPFSTNLFKGMLAFFLLDMGLKVAHHFPQARQNSAWLIAYAVVAPMVHAALALGLAALLGLSVGDAALLMVLSASASYIVVPAVLRDAMPEANPALYFGLSLGITFPLNLILGIPAYTWAARQVLSG
ncbi:sodium-dependent bicarbonate transport family permease [Aquabacterium lacunae]|uniref:Sodium-dependent bicarbonate transport family permease n=1 Tax=Aquabacterium lacunae TaxID=2528630 RepID=A0A4Q9H4M3_9BURK|nr:sodium-dependent bicarbonate transport family permease [Aquabacterium lacunae]TBO31129.1 sodium-dependent bicarbonate transport family permease [Aquabacterium lacunae]